MCKFRNPTVNSQPVFQEKFDLTKGFTNWAGTMQGVCPNDLAFLASQWHPGQAFMPIVVWGTRARYSNQVEMVIGCCVLIIMASSKCFARDFCSFNN